MFRLLRNFRANRIMVVAIIIFTFLETFGTLWIPTLTAQIVDNGIVKGKIPTILHYGGWMIVVAVGTGAVAVCSSWLSTRLSSRISGRIRDAVFVKAQTLTVSDFHKFGVSSMITRATGDVANISQIAIMSLQMLLPAPLMVISGLFLAFSKNRLLALIIVAAMVLFILFTVFFGKRIIPLFKLMQLKMDSMTQLLRENIIGVRVIRAFNREAYERARVEKAAMDYADNSIRINKRFALFQPVILLIVNACILVIIWVSGKGSIPIGDTIAMVEYCFLILHALIMALLMVIYIPKAQVSAERINQVLDAASEPREQTITTTPIPSSVAHIEFDHVAFQYPSAEEPVLDKISFAARRGEVTAIIGGTGSGKSTIAQLLLRFFDVQGGGIRIDGRDIRGMSQKQRLCIARALVRKPEIYIFDDSFSALDFRTDAKLRQALKKETQDSTVIIVAQRISTIVDADRIVVLDQGRIAGSGTHRELMRACPVYQQIAFSQLSDNELAEG